MAEIIEPCEFSPRNVKALRHSLQLSTAVFAGVVGVSKKLVEQWESGLRKPSPMACRLLDAIKREPGPFLSRTTRPAA